MNYIRNDNKSLTIVINKVVSILDLNIIEKYIKNTNIVESEEVIIVRLPQSKLYLKILGISYLIKNTNIPISADNVKKSYLVYSYIQ